MAKEIEVDYTVTSKTIDGKVEPINMATYQQQNGEGIERLENRANTPAVVSIGTYLQQNGGVPLDHPRRCVAHTHAGQPCRRYAVRGANVCRVHGGAAPQVVAKARERLALAADTMAKMLLGIASGAESEAVKLAAVKDALDRAGVPAKAEVAIEIKPYEELLMGIVGIATVPRHAHQPALVDPADVIDAELADPPELGPGIGPRSPVGERKPDDPPSDSASSTAQVALPPVSASYEDAPAVMRAARLRTDTARRTRRRH
jgi:hypothetical protein